MLIMRTGLSVHLWLWPILLLEIGVLFLGAGLTSAHGADIKDNRATEILSNFRQSDEQIGPLFKDAAVVVDMGSCLLYTSPSPRDGLLSRMPSSA